jgi:N,N'-diacetyllegionaminate synthase
MGKVKYVAEIGMNHNGNFGLLEALIREAKYAGADCVKFQLGWREGEGELNVWSDQELKRAFDLADFYEIEMTFSLINQESLKRVKKLGLPLPWVKVASRTLIDGTPLFEQICSSFDSVIASLGFVGNIKPATHPENVKFLRCSSQYPSDPWTVEKSLFEYDQDVIGFSCHYPGIEASLLAIASGAQLIEKHFTLDRSNVSIRDHALSATPAEFSQLTRLGDKMSRIVVR